MSSSKNYSTHAPTKNLKRKRSFHDTEENSESSMQPARRRYKKAYESTTLDDRVVPSVEPHDERSFKCRSKSNHKNHSSSRVVQEYIHRIERESPETSVSYSTSHTREKSSDKPMIRVLTPSEINSFSSVSNESSNDAENEVYILPQFQLKTDFFGTEKEIPSGSHSNSRTSSSKVESTRRSSGRSSGDRTAPFGFGSMIKKILEENRKTSEMSSDKNCTSNKRDGEYSCRKSTSRVRRCSPSQSKRLHGTSLGENEDSDRYQGSNFSRNGYRISDSNINSNPLEIHSLDNRENSYETPPVSSKTSSSKYKQLESPTERSESRSESRRNSGVSLVNRDRHNEKESSRMSSSRSCSSSSRRRDHDKYPYQSSTSGRIHHSPSKSSRSSNIRDVSREEETDDLCKLKRQNSLGKGRRVIELDVSSKPGETDCSNSTEESSKADCISSRMSFTRQVESPSNSFENSEESISSNNGESPPSREVPNWTESHTPKTPDEYSLSWDSEGKKCVKKSPEKLIPYHTKKRDLGRLCTMTVTYKNKYFSPAKSKGSLSTPRRDRYSPRKYKLPSSTPRKGNKESDSYQRATPWVADFLSSKEDSDTPRARPKISHPKLSRGPFLCSYQLLGDSLLVRFADQILSSKAVIGENGKYCNGLCVSGQTIDGLIEKVLNCNLPLEQKVIVLIGTNDFLKGSTFGEVKSCMLRLLDLLKERVSEIMLLTVPPIPRLKTSTFWDDWEKYNRWLKELHDGNAIRVLDTARLYLRKPREPYLSCYERFMGYGSRKRPDLIHLNREGLRVMHQEIINYVNKMK